MKIIKNIKEFLNESLAPSKQERFDRAIYLTYVESRNQKNYKPVTKEIFYDKLRDKVKDRKTIDYDKSRIYRLADMKEIWLDNRGDILGEAWFEFKTDDDEHVESYWINTEKVEL